MKRPLAHRFLFVPPLYGSSMVFNVVPTAFEVSLLPFVMEERQLLRCSFSLWEQPEQRTGSRLYSCAQQRGAAAAA